MTEIREIRQPVGPEVMDPCERCGTPLALMRWEGLQLGESGELEPAEWDRQWYEYEWFTIPESGHRVMRSFRPHTPERCTEEKTRWTSSSDRP